MVMVEGGEVEEDCSGLSMTKWGEGEDEGFTRRKICTGGAATVGVGVEEVIVLQAAAGKKSEGPSLRLCE